MDSLILKELEKSFDQLDIEQLEKAMDLIKSSKRIFVHGTGRSGLMLKAFAMRLMQLGFTSYVVGETTTPSIDKGDLLILASASGSTDSVISMAEKCKDKGIELFVISANTNSDLANIKNIDLLIKSSDKYSQNDYSLQPMGSLFEQMLLLSLDQLIYLIYNETGNIEKLQKNHANLE